MVHAKAYAMNKFDSIKLCLLTVSFVHIGLVLVVCCLISSSQVGKVSRSHNCNDDNMFFSLTAGAVIHLGDDAQLDQLRTASYILATPESILAKKGRSLLRDKTFQARLKTVFIDECHCVITQ